MGESAQSYPLARGPLAFADVFSCVRDSVTAAKAEAPEREALTFRRGVAWLLPGYARTGADTGQWVPKTGDEWMRLAAYSGAVDAWEGSSWRAARGQPPDEAEAYATAYTVAWSATNNARQR